MEDTAVAAVPEEDNHDNVDDQEEDELFCVYITLVFGSMTMPKTRNTKKKSRLSPLQPQATELVNASEGELNYRQSSIEGTN